MTRKLVKIFLTVKPKMTAKVNLLCITLFREFGEFGKFGGKGIRGNGGIWGKGERE
jgi:hypothetical protein